MKLHRVTKAVILGASAVVLLYLAVTAMLTLLPREPQESPRPHGQQVLSNYAFESWVSRGSCGRYPAEYRFMPENWTYRTDHMDNLDVYCKSMGMVNSTRFGNAVVIYREPYHPGLNNEIAYLISHFTKPASKVTNDTLTVSFLLKLGNSTHPTSQVMLVRMNSAYNAEWFGELWVDQPSGRIIYGWFEPAINYWRWVSYSTAFTAESWYRIKMTFTFNCTGGPRPQDPSCSPASFGQGRLGRASLRITWEFQKLGQSWILIDSKQVDASRIFWLIGIVIGDSGPNGSYSGFGIWAGERDVDGAWLEPGT